MVQPACSSKVSYSRMPGPDNFASTKSSLKDSLLGMFSVQPQEKKGETVNTYFKTFWYMNSNKVI